MGWYAKREPAGSAAKDRYAIFGFDRDGKDLFGSLKAGLRQGLPINEEFYRSWGTKEELMDCSFNRWWKVRGRALFEKAEPRALLVEVSEDFVTVRIPTSLSAVQVKKQVSALVTKERGTKRLKKKAALAFAAM